MSPTTPSTKHMAIALNGVHDAEGVEAIERALRASPHISDVRVHLHHDNVHVTYHAGMIEEDEIERLVASSGRTKPAEADGQAHPAAPVETKAGTEAPSAHSAGHV